MVVIIIDRNVQIKIFVHFFIIFIGSWLAFHGIAIGRTKSYLAGKLKNEDLHTKKANKY